jgi:enoyl-CoA hydratase/carnithine racemase
MWYHNTRWIAGVDQWLIAKRQVFGQKLEARITHATSGSEVMTQALSNDMQSRGEAVPAVLRREDRGPVAVLTLNRPEARNSLSEDLIAALHRTVAAIGADDSIRAMVITGAGTAFSAGHDLKELTAHRTDPDRGRAYFAKIMEACSKLMLSIVHSPKPVIAAVNGIATAAGCQLVAACDLAVASADARFATPGVNIGLFCSTPMVALSRNLSRKAAMEMLLLGDMVPASEAKELGLVNRVVKSDETVNEAVELGRRIATKPKATLSIGKDAFYRQLEMPLEEAYAYTTAVMVENMLHAEAQEGIGAFLEKRDPRWPR